MRYLVDHVHDERTTALAEALFERYVGRVIATQLYDERIAIRNHRGRLTHTPIVTIEKVVAQVEQSAFVPWSMDDVLDATTVVPNEYGDILVPSSMLGEPYTTAHVTYTAGYATIPDDITKVVAEIASLVSQGVMDEWSGEQALSGEARSTIARYRR